MSRSESLDLGRAAARDELAVLDDDRDDPDRVLKGAVQLVDHVLGAAAHEDRDRLRVLAARDVGHLLAGGFFSSTEPAKPSSSAVIASIDETSEAPVARASFSMSDFLTRRRAKTPAFAR